MGVTVDSSFIIDYLRGAKRARAKSAELDLRGELLFLTAPALFEVLTGLIVSRSRLQASAFRALASAFTVLPFDGEAAEKAAMIRGELLRAGHPQSPTDIMIAAIAAVGGHSVVTRDRGFDLIAETAALRIEAY